MPFWQLLFHLLCQFPTTSICLLLLPNLTATTNYEFIELKTHPTNSLSYKLRTHWTTNYIVGLVSKTAKANWRSRQINAGKMAGGANWRNRQIIVGKMTVVKTAVVESTFSLIWLISLDALKKKKLEAHGFEPPDNLWPGVSSKTKFPESVYPLW